MPDEAL